MTRPLAVGCMLASAIPAFGAEPARKPLIAINMAVAEIENSEDLTLSIRSTYVDSVVKAGGIPILLPPVLEEEHIRRYCELADGFIFVGGPDINPKRFGQEPHPAMKPIVPRREEFDFLLMERALETRKPVLAVCLGMQELTVSGGGSILQDIPSLMDTPIDHRPGGGARKEAHEVEVVPGTILHRLVGTTTLSVNSIHHQAAESVGEGTIVSARANDGIIEAVELRDHPFAIGLQWHPEFLTNKDPHLKIFEGLVDEAVRQRASSAPVEAAEPAAR